VDGPSTALPAATAHRRPASGSTPCSGGVRGWLRRPPARARPDLPLPLHQLVIGAIGLTLLDWPQLDGVVALCAQLGRREFLLTVAPLQIVGGTGSPVNPTATF